MASGVCVYIFVWHVMDSIFVDVFKDISQKKTGF